MGFYGDVKPGDTFKPSATLENDVRHFLNRLNGFSGGPITAGNPGIIRIPVYNATSAALQVGKAVSIDISGIIANGCYPAIAFSDTLPCYGVLVKDLDPAEAGDCILSGLGVVQIASTPETGNYASPGTDGVFARGDEGVPILNVSGTAAVVMLGSVKTNGGGEVVGMAFPDWSKAKHTIVYDATTGWNMPHDGYLQTTVYITNQNYDSCNIYAGAILKHGSIERLLVNFSITIPNGGWGGLTFTDLIPIKKNTSARVLTNASGTGTNVSASFDLYWFE